MSDSASSFNELKDNESTSPSTSIPINTSLLHADKPLPSTVPKPASVQKATISSDYSTLFIPAPHPAFSVDWFTHYLKQTRVLVVLALFIFTLVLVIWIAALGKAGASKTGPGVVCTGWASGLGDVLGACPSTRAEVYYVGSARDRGVIIDGNLVSSEDVAVQPFVFFVPNAIPSYYYTAVMMDTTTASGGYAQVRAIGTNLRLGETANGGSGEWIYPYDRPESLSTTHTYVWAIYRHSQENTANKEYTGSQNNFNVQDWINSWPQRATLVAAAWFEVRN